MKALLAVPPDTQKGNRDRMIMILLFDTAIRIAELLELKISSLKLTSVPSIHIHGKGFFHLVIIIKSIIRTGMPKIFT